MIQVRRGPVIAVAAIALVALLVPLLPLADPLRPDQVHSLAPPSLPHLLGQDENGRDVLSRLLWAGRTSLGIAAASGSLACLFGTVIGMSGGFISLAFRRIAGHGMGTLPRPPLLPLALLIMTLAGPGVGTLIPMFAVLYARRFVGVAYAAIVLSVRSQNCAAALRAVLRHLAGPLLVQLTRTASSALVLESGLSFLGLVVMPPTPSWGQMIDAARATMSQAPLLLLWPCAALSLTILAMQALSASLREAMGFHGQHAQVRQHADTRLPPPGRPPIGTAVLDVRNLSVVIGTPSGAITALRDVSFTVQAGETLAIVGESGAGKTLTGLAIMGLLPDAARVCQGHAWLQGHDLLRLDDEAFRRVRGGVLSMAFQDALSSFNPVHRVGAQIAETMHAHFDVPRYEAKEEVATLLDRVGVSAPERCARAYPHELSSDTRQRAMIAMAIANDPRLLIVDEPTAGLDVTAQGQILELIANLQREFRMGLVYMSRSLSVASKVADRVFVLRAGEVVEEGLVRDILAGPMQPYTAALL